MNQYNQNKTNGHVTRSEFEKERAMVFYVPVGAILFELDITGNLTGTDLSAQTDNFGNNQSTLFDVGTGIGVLGRPLLAYLLS